MTSYKTTIPWLIVYTMFILSCKDSIQHQKVYQPDNQNIHYIGRIDFTDPLKPKLSSAGSYFRFRMRGTSCTLLLENQYEEPNHNYISVEIDGQYHKRIKVTQDTSRYVIAENLPYGTHSILVCKATESFIGYIGLQGIQCKKIMKTRQYPVHAIEFIGNSITSGAEMDTAEFPCDSGVWHDRHNAYLAYGPLVARSLNASWVLSSISGMGLTRNWNNEGPGLPAFYDNLYLNDDSTKLWTAGIYSPELVTICLGTNDNSPGDGSYDRKPLDSSKYVNKYIDFVAHIRSRHPQSVICLINSPVFGGSDREIFNAYLESVVNSVRSATGDKKIFSFSYSSIYGKGCSGHPAREEHQQMANELLPYLRGITGW